MLSLTSPVRTPFHPWPVGLKLALLALITFAIFLSDSLAVHAGALVGVALAYALCGRVFTRDALRLMRPIWIFVALILAWHLLTSEPELGLRIALRMVVLVALANLVTMTSRLSDMIALVTRLLAPLRRIGVNPAMIGLAAALFIRFVPVLTEKGAHLAEAWRARSPRRPGWRLAVPVTLLALDDAEQVAEALKARGGVPNE
ncbi:energy-coupling factor transporter transmembrane protein EcfT [Aquicoccus sp. SCR17]|nr:energy-coupling factor transporter transmembrane protein EcfT [Carideicomes alvinocaridis]